MASVVEMCNVALLQLGADAIISIDDNTVRARLCKQFYPKAFEVVARSAVWLCLKKQFELAEVAIPPKFDWGHAFQLDPSIVRILRAQHDPDFKVFGRQVYSDTSPLNINAIWLDPDPNHYDVLLQEAISARLAHYITYPVTQKLGVARDMWAAYQAKIKEARTVNGQEEPHESLYGEELIEVRR